MEEKEKTYQAWYGIEDLNGKTTEHSILHGMYFDEFGNMKFYDNETDNYWQNHFQLHWTEKNGLKNGFQMRHYITP